jgi:hypothetical protein
MKNRPKILLLDILFIFCSIVSQAQSEINFTEHIIVGNLNYANCVYTADMDNDGDIDILGSAWLDQQICWWENDGSQDYTQHIIRSDFNGAGYVYAEDIDDDGDMDITGAAAELGDIVWWENDGNQNFSEHPITLSYSNAIFAYPVDIDGDTDIDILGCGNAGVTWWENDGSQNFVARTVATGLGYINSVHAIDVDGDDDIDLLGMAYTINSIFWWENDGSENFAQHVIDNNYQGAFFIYAVDLDLDSDTDILSTAETADDITWWENDGAESFTKHTISGNFDGASCVYAEDLDDDGDLDVFGTALNSGLASWWENNGAQIFTEHNISQNLWHAIWIYASDVDLDGDIDVLGAGGLAQKIVWWESDLMQFTRVTEGPHVNDANISMGISWIDYDNDSYPDIFVANDDGNNNLYKNNGDGTFSNNESDVIVSEGNSYFGCFADYDNDGDLDVIVTNGVPHDSESNYFYSNNGDGTFTKLMDNIITSDIRESRVANFVDYNNDGYLDVYVANHSSTIPNGYAPDMLYQNIGYDFIQITEGDIITNATITTYSSWCDYDNDGDQDIYLEKPFGLNVLYENNANGTFTRNSAISLANDYDIGSFCWGDYDNDGNMDMFSPVYQDNNNILYKNDGNGDFIKVSDQILVNDNGWSSCGSWGDYDNDGYIDLFVTNSMYTMYTNNNFLYRNNGNGTFSKVTDGVIVEEWSPSTSASWCDYDCDGDLDMYVTVWAGDLKNLLFKNNGNSNNWINVKCSGTISNRSAIGAKIHLFAVINGSDIWQLREISTNSGLCAQNSLEVHFGLGDATMIDSIKIEWPSGSIQMLADVAVNQFLTITEILCGDVDGSEIVDILDIVFFIDWKFKDGPIPESSDVLDVNADGAIDILDIIHMIDWKFKDGSLPACLN